MYSHKHAGDAIDFPAEGSNANVWRVHAMKHEEEKEKKRVKQDHISKRDGFSLPVAQKAFPCRPPL